MVLVPVNLIYVPTRLRGQLNHRRVISHVCKVHTRASLILSFVIRSCRVLAPSVRFS